LAKYGTFVIISAINIYLQLLQKLQWHSYRDKLSNTCAYQYISLSTSNTGEQAYFFGHVILQIDKGCKTGNFKRRLYETFWTAGGYPFLSVTKTALSIS